MYVLLVGSSKVWRTTQFSNHPNLVGELACVLYENLENLIGGTRLSPQSKMEKNDLILQTAGIGMVIKRIKTISRRRRGQNNKKISGEEGEGTKNENYQLSDSYVCQARIQDSRERFSVHKVIIFELFSFWNEA